MITLCLLWVGWKVWRKEEGQMKIKKIDHICVAVKDLEEARKKWEPLLGKAGLTMLCGRKRKHTGARYVLGEWGSS
jgi:methylmalonyl-CoA/ethylmalonyl-CoA epimerase